MFTKPFYRKSVGSFMVGNERITEVTSVTAVSTSNFPVALPIKRKLLRLCFAIATHADLTALQ